jgi:DNA-binding NarL/FixJ family response regulator
MPRILIADSRGSARTGYRKLLEEDFRSIEIAEAAQDAELFELLRSAAWDLLLLDLDFSGQGGLDTLKRVRSDHPQLPLLAVSGLPETVYARDAIRAGASGYLAKDSAAEELAKAVRTALLGRRYVSPTLAQILADDLGSGASTEAVHTRLSAREFQIFSKLAAGVAVTKIARELSLSVKTISTYRTRALEKMTLTSNAEMTDYALRNKLISP